MSQHDVRDCDKPKLCTVTFDKSQFDNPLSETDTLIEVKMKEYVRLFCEQVNNLACDNMLKPPYKLEGQHKRAMVILARQLNIELSFSDEAKE